MFTGIIEELGTVRGVRRAGRSLELTVGAHVVTRDLKEGDSVAVNGVCLTVTRFNAAAFVADVMPETFDRTALRHLGPGHPVNLERTMQVGARFGGHMVQGHVDGVGQVTGVTQDEIARVVTIAAPPEVMRYVVPKGSVAVDGTSLTVMAAGPDWFSVGIIPHTATMTTLGRRQPGDAVNLEADILGKYVEKFVLARLGQAGGEPAGITPELLARHGFLSGGQAG